MAITDKASYTAEKPATVARGKRFRENLWVGTAGLALMILAIGVTSYERGQDSRDKDVAAAEANGERAEQMALALGRSGITNVVNLQRDPQGYMLATMSAQPGTADACERTFFATMLPEGPQLTMPLRDAAGQTYDTVTVTNGATATQALAKLCD